MVGMIHIIAMVQKGFEGADLPWFGFVPTGQECHEALELLDATY